MDIKATVDERKTKSSKIEPEEIAGFESRYDSILEKGFLENPPPIKVKGKRGRIKQNKARNMLDRLKEHRQETLAFMYDFQVPFDIDNS